MKKPIIEHFVELRKRIIGYFAVLFIVFIACFYFVDELLQLLIFTDKPLVFIRVQEVFVVHMQVAFAAAFIISFPFLLYQLWAFISPGLGDKEKKSLMLYVPTAMLLFCAGIALAYFALVPFGVNFLLDYGSVRFEPMITLQSYVSLVLIMLLLSGLLFELPLVIIFLNRIGMLSRETLKKNRFYFYVFAFILSGIVTPTTDAITQTILAVPLIILYEISIFFAKD
jgi:sec-independent protein translocase protein TatC